MLLLLTQSGLAGCPLQIDLCARIDVTRLDGAVATHGMTVGLCFRPQRLMDELEEFLSGRGLQFFLIDCAVAVRISGLKFLGNDRFVLFHV